MPTEICSHCKTQVLRRTDGNCPACGMMIDRGEAEQKNVVEPKYGSPGTGREPASAAVIAPDRPWWFLHGAREKRDRNETDERSENEAIHWSSLWPEASERTATAREMC